MKPTTQFLWCIYDIHVRRSLLRTKYLRWGMMQMALIILRFIYNIDILNQPSMWRFLAVCRTRVRLTFVMYGQTNVLQILDQRIPCPVSATKTPDMILQFRCDQWSRQQQLKAWLNGNLYLKGLLVVLACTSLSAMYVERRNCCDLSIL